MFYKGTLNAFNSIQNSYYPPSLRRRIPQVFISRFSFLIAPSSYKKFGGKVSTSQPGCNSSGLLAAILFRRSNPDIPMPTPQTTFLGPHNQMLSFLHWLNSNWQAVCGWCTGVYLTYRIGKFFTDIVLKVKSVVERFEAAESTLVSVATNHLPHMQWELEKTNATMTSVDQTLKKMYKQQVGDYE